MDDTSVVGTNILFCRTKRVLIFMPYSLFLWTFSTELFFDASTTIYLMEINFHKFKFRVD